MLDNRLSWMPFLQQLAALENIIDLVIQLATSTDAFGQVFSSLVRKILAFVVIGGIHYAVLVLEETTPRDVRVFCQLLVIIVFLFEEADEEAGEVGQIG